MDELNNIKKYAIEVGLIVIMMIDLFIKTLPIVPMASFVLLYMVFMCNFYEKAFLFLLFYPPAIGLIANTMGVGGIGGWFTILGIILVIYGIMSDRAKLYAPIGSSVSFLLVMSLFLLSAMGTMGGSYAMTKVQNTFVNGAIALLAYLFFFSNNNKFDVQKIGVFYILMSAIMLRMSIVTNDIYGPSNLVDFNFLRFQSMENKVGEGAAFRISYQNTGFMCVQGIGFFLMARIREINTSTLIMMFLATIVVFYAGSRQAVVTVLIMLGILFFQTEKRGIAGKLMIPLIGLSIVYVLLQFLTADEGLLNSVSEEGYVDGGGRGPWLLEGLRLFYENPIWGVGYGRYSIFGIYGTYPHNLFVELLSETGIIGLIVVVGLVLRSILSNKTSFMLIVYLFMAMFLRSMASGGLDMNIVMITMLFALPALTINKSDYNGE